MTDEAAALSTEQIKYLVDRFLNWRLPKNFQPDNGIKFDAYTNIGTEFQMRREPVGTNLFDATQAEAMVRHMLDGMPTPPVSRDAGVLNDDAMMPPLWALGHMPMEWGPLPGVGPSWGWLLEHGYIELEHGYVERNDFYGPYFQQVRITKKGLAILAVRTPGPTALAAMRTAPIERDAGVLMDHLTWAIEKLDECGKQVEFTVGMCRSLDDCRQALAAYRRSDGGEETKW